MGEDLHPLCKVGVEIETAARKARALRLTPAPRDVAALQVLREYMLAW